MGAADFCVAAEGGEGGVMQTVRINPEQAAVAASGD